MKKIFVIGAGLSASSLLRYLRENAAVENWFIKVCDRDEIWRLTKRKVAIRQKDLP